MPRSKAQTRRRILDAAYDLFYRRGFVRVSIDEVAARAGITKRTFYAHFESKDALLAATLDLHHGLALERTRRWSVALAERPEALVERLFADLATWAARPRWQGPGFTRLAWELADLPGHPARTVARRHKAAIEDWLADQLATMHPEGARERARQVMVLLEGCQSLMLIFGDPSYAATAARAARHILAERPEARQPAIRPRQSLRSAAGRRAVGPRASRKSKS